MGATGKKIKGKVMQFEGKLTGDKARVAKGVATEKLGDAEGAVTRAKRKTKRTARTY